MSEKESYVRWLKKGFANLKDTLKDPSERRLLRGLGEFILAALGGGGIVGFGVQVHWIFIILGIAVVVLLVSHGLYLWEHFSDC